MSEEKTQAHRRHDVSDRVWSLLEPHLPGRRGAWGGLPRITVGLSTRFSGYYGQERRGGIFRRTMAAGATRIAALSAGVTRGCGRSS